jgi:type II secretion system protein J
MKPTQPRERNAPGFTLMELLLAIGVAAIALIAINAVFFTAMRLRDSTTRAVDQSLPVERTLDLLRRDLAGAMPPVTNGILSGDFRVGDIADLGLSQPVNIELYTTTGALRADEPWSEVRRVTYELRLPADRSAPGKDLIRSVTRNLLTDTAPQPDDQWLMGGVQSIQFLCYDGFQWRDYWDTTLTDTNLPTAVRVRIQLAGANNAPGGEPIEMVVPVDAQPRNLPTTGGS